MQPQNWDDLKIHIKEFKEHGAQTILVATQRLTEAIFDHPLCPGDWHLSAASNRFCIPADRATVEYTLARMFDLTESKR